MSAFLSGSTPEKVSRGGYPPRGHLFLGSALVGGNLLISLTFLCDFCPTLIIITSLYTSDLYTLLYTHNPCVVCRSVYTQDLCGIQAGRHFDGSRRMGLAHFTPLSRGMVQFHSESVWNTEPPGFSWGGISF